MSDFTTNLEVMVIIVGICAFFWRLDALLRKLIDTVKSMDLHQTTQHDKFVKSLEDIGAAQDGISHRLVEINTRLEQHILDEQIHRRPES